MKKGKLITTTLTLLVFIISLVSQINSFGQIMSPTDIDPPTGLTATIVDGNDVSLYWLQPTTADSTYLHWDSGEYFTQYGNFLQPVEMDYVAKWDPTHITTYDEWTITKMRFIVASPHPTIKLKIWTGPNATEVYTQDVTDFNVNTWTEITLDTPVTIDASTQLWAGLNIDMPYTGVVMGCDEGPAIPGTGDNYRYNGVWYKSGLNWNIQIKIEEPAGKEVNNLLGYNVYRNDEQINENTWTSTSYLDETLLNGTYDYHITAVYDDGESTASNVAQIVIEEPGILAADSLALVDLYNECNGINWWGQDHWLTGPVSDWYGVTTTGNRVTTLWRQSNSLTGDIPESIGDLTALTELHLESNQITSIPETIGNLEALRIFWLGWNPISSIPETIGNLTNLEQLHIGLMDVDMPTLPATFGNLESLNWLGLGGSGLNSLPENFGDLTALEVCFLWGNNLTELPASFGQCESMHHLDISDNQITYLPDNFGDMDNLNTLYADNNLLVSLPVGFGELSSMFLLELSHNNLTSISDNFGDMTNLSWLDLLGNQLSTLPESFGSLSSLDSVYIEYNQLTSLPSTFGNLSDLNLLGLEYNQISQLPASFGNLATIEEIYLTDNHLTSLPEDFSNMPELFLLVLSQNNLTRLPESLCDLPSLQFLYVHQNQLEEIPTNIGNIETLTYMVMDQNNITEIPVSIGSLVNLETLSFNHNSISEIPSELGNLDLVQLGLGGNNISEFPSSMFDNAYYLLYAQENNLQFGSLEPFVGNVNTYEYYDQAMIGEEIMVDIPYFQPISYTIEVTGDDNIYKWYKDGIIMPNQNSNTLYIPDASNEDVGVYVLKVSNSSVIGLVLESYTYTVSDITSVDGAEFTEFEIYPNPSKGNSINLTVNNPEEVEQIIFINGTGQIVKEETVFNQSNSIDVSRLTEGVYIVKVLYSNGQSQVKRLLIN